MTTRIELYDTTLRDGAQAEGFSLSAQDMLRVARRLDELGMTYIEGGWPGSNPRDREFFARAGELKLARSRLVAFGSTHHKDQRPETDGNLTELLRTPVEVVALVGKSSSRHVETQLGVPLTRNLEIIEGSVAYLAGQGRTVFFDAEHFFDGAALDREYSLAVLEAAARGGAGALVLCDTNGGNLPQTIAGLVGEVCARWPQVTVGIHCHNDAELAVACSLAAVAAGARQVQGTMNGFGERCGNANLCSIIPTLQFKMGCDCLEPERMRLLTSASRFVSELANLSPSRYAPYVGLSAFSHKGGLHISAVEKDPGLYEHLSPEEVGNQRRLMVSDLSGRAVILGKARQWGLIIEPEDPMVRELLAILKDRERLGYQYEGAEASFELMMNQALGREQRWFELIGFRVTDFKASEGEEPQAEATVRVKVGEEEAHTAATGDGPVHALDRAIRKALTRFFPRLVEMRLVDYKVRVLSGADGTASHVRVLIESSDGAEVWGTVGVSFDVIEASWQALGDSIRYKLFKDARG